VSGTWKIIVNIVPHEEVSVVHYKTAVSKSPPPEGGYEFEWELVMKFDWDLSQMKSAELNTKSVKFSPAILEENKKEVQNIINKFKTGV